MTPASGHMAGTRHVLAIRVYYEDTDAAGIVYYANYLKFAERGRTEFLRLAGIDQSRLREERGLFFAVRRAEVEYLRPARLDDVLRIETQLTDMTAVKIDALQTISRAEEELARVRMRVVCLKVDGRPARMPKDIAARFQSYVRPLGEAGSRIGKTGDEAVGAAAQSIEG